MTGRHIGLSDVSRTAIATLRSRAIESERPHPLIKDPMARVLLDGLVRRASEEERRLLFERKLSSHLTMHLAIRSRKYDSLVRDFLKKRPKATVVDLGCGLDTRRWRLPKCRYIELDLPEIVKLKKAVLKDRIDYEIIALSVLDPAWMDRVTEDGNRDFMLVAEGLLMYLKRPDVIGLFKDISKRFYRSRFAFEVVRESYTRGLMKRLVVYKMKRQLGYDAGSSYDFGIKDAKEIGSFAKGIKVVGEWSYVEDPDTRPRMLKYLGISRTQWTVIADINAGREAR